jgi:periplasmic protein TonB
MLGHNMLRYNVPKLGRKQPGSANAAFRSAQATRRPATVGSGVISVILHAGLIGAAITFVRVPLPPKPDELTVGMVFQAPETTPAAEPMHEAPASLASSDAPAPSPPAITVPEPPVEVPPRPPETPPMATQEAGPPEPARPEPKPRPVARPLPAKVPPRPPIVTAPTAPAERAVAPPPPSLAQPAIDGGWLSSVASWVAGRKTYPEDARQRGEEGRVVIRFTVDRTGRVIEAAIVGSSGSARLDAATVALLRGAVLPALPASMPGPNVTITTSVRYNLR